MTAARAADPVADEAVDIFLSWINHQQGASYVLTGEGAPWRAVTGDASLAIHVGLLYDVDADPAWSRRRRAVARQLVEAGSGPLSLWIPPQTGLTHIDRADVIRRIVEAASGLAPGQRGQVEFPVSLTLRKLSDEASYVQVRGGLAPYWARLTGRAFGQYDLETEAIHRLPEPESRVQELLDWVVLVGNGMKAGTSSEIKAEDAWTIRRPLRGEWTVVIGAPPESDPANGTSVRRLLRRALKSAAEEQATAARRALVVLAVAQTLEQETATIALRGCDPGLYSLFDVICLVADGGCKSLFGPRPGWQN